MDGERTILADDRAQVYTLEGIIAALVVMTGLLFALQATTATPQAAGITNPQAQQQDRALVRGVLAAADDDDLREAVLYWDQTTDGFHCTPGGTSYYPAPNTSQTSGPGSPGVPAGCPAADTNRSEWVPPNDFGGLLHQHLGTGYSYNVHVTYNDSGTLERERMVYQGQAGDGVVRATTSVAIADGQRLYDADGTLSSDDVGSGFYAPDVSGGDLHTVLHLEVTAWRG